MGVSTASSSSSNAASDSGLEMSERAELGLGCTGRCRSADSLQFKLLDAWAEQPEVRDPGLLPRVLLLVPAPAPAGRLHCSDSGPEPGPLVVVAVLLLTDQSSFVGRMAPSDLGTERGAPEGTSV